MLKKHLQRIADFFLYSARREIAAPINIPGMTSFLSPAKINLFLKVVRRRTDGYHDLASLFQTIDLCDTLTFIESEDDRLTCNNPALATDPNNLVLRALNLFRKRTGFKQCFAIQLEKRIPMQAGLGGGSSNAATTLWALRSLTGSNISDETLCAWGAELGSDVPFFLASHGTAYCTGRGEIVKDLPAIFSHRLHLIKPPEGVSTPEVFRRLDLAALKASDPEAILNQFIDGRPEFFNDLEAPVLALIPSLRSLKTILLGSGFSTVLMTGSGSSFFCLGESQFAAPPSYFVHACSTIQRQPGAWW